MSSDAIYLAPATRHECPRQEVALWSNRLQHQPLHEVLHGRDNLSFGGKISAVRGNEVQILQQRRTKT